MAVHLKHEQKICPHCKNLFDCKVSNIAHCGCTAIAVSVVTSNYISAHFEDCLCNNCLQYFENLLNAAIPEE